MQRIDARRPEVQRDAAHVDHVEQRLDVVADEIVVLLSGHARGSNPGGNEVRRVLLIKALSRDAVGIAGQHHRPIAQVRQQPGRDVPVIVDEIALGVPLLGPEDLVEVGEGDLALHRRHRRRRFRRDAVERRLVGAESQERRLSKQASLGNFLISNLHDELRLDPGVPGATGQRAGARRCRDAQRLQLGARLRHFLLAEPAADFSHVKELAVARDRDVHRAESGARSFALAETDDREIANAIDADLLPVAKAPAAVRRLRAFGDDAFQPQLAHAGKQSATAAFHVIHQTDGSNRRNQPRQQSFTLDQRQRAQVELFEGEQIEEEERRRQLGRCTLDVPRRGEQRALLQPLENRPPGFVQHRDLAVGDESIGRKREQRARQIGKDRRRVRAAPVEHARP